MTSKAASRLRLDRPRHSEEGNLLMSQSLTLPWLNTWRTYRSRNNPAKGFDTVIVNGKQPSAMEKKLPSSAGGF
jgi:hypothetical protein